MIMLLWVMACKESTFTSVIVLQDAVIIFGRRCVIEHQDQQLRVATSIQSTTSGEHCTCSLSGSGSGLNCTYFRTECPKLQQIIFN